MNDPYKKLVWNDKDIHIQRVDRLIVEKIESKLSFNVVFQ